MIPANIKKADSKTFLKEFFNDLQQVDFEDAPKTLEGWAKLMDLREQVTGKTSDGYHTFDELYEYRMLYNAHFFNALAYLYDEYGLGEGKPVKSKRHSDGELCFGGGWFIVVVQLPTGQISNHYKLEDWDLFQIDEAEKAPEYDGHTPQDVAKRLRAELERTS